MDMVVLVVTGSSPESREIREMGRKSRDSLSDTELGQGIALSLLGPFQTDLL